MTTVTTYSMFIAKQGVLSTYGGGWEDISFGYPCTQSVSGDIYGPIIGTAYPTPSGRFMDLDANITLTTMDFPGATSLTYTFKWHAVATFQGGNPSTINVRTLAGPTDNYYDTVSYTADGTSVSYSGVLNGRPVYIPLHIQTGMSNLNGSHVTIAYSPITFELHDATSGAASTPGNPASPSAARSSVSYLSSTGSALNSVTTSTAFLPSSTSFTTTISGHATVIASQSLPDSPSNFPNNTSMTVVERVGVVVGSLVGVGLILAAIAFWYQWKQRRRVLQFEGTPYVDRKSEISRSPRMTNLEPYGIPTTNNPLTILTATEGNGTGEVELVRSRQPRRHRRMRREMDGYAFGPPPPSYSQITPR